MVGARILGRHHVSVQCLEQGLRELRAAAHPLRKQRATVLDVFSRVHDRLPIQLEAVSELRDEHHCSALVLRHYPFPSSAAFWLQAELTRRAASNR